MSGGDDKAVLPLTEADLLAYVDGQLPEARRGEVEAYLAAHSEEAERIAAWRHQNQELRALYDGVLDEPLPERLRAAAEGRAGESAAPLVRPRWSSYARAAGYACAGLAVGVLAGWQLQPAHTPAALGAAPGLARSAAVAHATYSPEVRHPVEVGADQEAHLVAWLSKRLGAQVRAPRLEAAGYSLVGGRLLPGEAGAEGSPTPPPVAQFMYQCKAGTRVTLYVSTGVADQGETAFRYEREGNVGVFYWIDRTQGYAMSSADIDKDALLSVATAAYKQLNP